MYCWGNSLRGELGTNEVIWTPKLSNWIFESEIQQVSNGLHHVLILTKAGQVYGCGYNNFGQLGMANSHTEPQKLPTLESLVMIQIACGDLYSVALNEWGQMFTWGCDSHGQLGHGIEKFQKGLFKPKMVKALGTKRIVQIACGCNHTVALTNGGEVYSWGGNSNGQLGIGTVCTVVRVPSVILALRGLPVSQIACGNEHTVVTTRSGAVYSWGRNRFGQLGNGQTEQRQTYPAEVRNLRRFHVVRVICGTERTLFMTRNGGVLSCGAILDDCGILSSDLLPRMVQELMGTVIVQVACGTRHSLAVSRSGRLYVWGCGFYGALGFGQDNIRLQIPTYLHLDTIQLNMYLKCIFAGGELSFVTMVNESDKNSLVDMRTLPTQMSILDLNEQQMNRYIHISEEDMHSDEFWPYIEQVFNCLGCLNASFIKEDDHIFKSESNYHFIDFEAAERTFDCIARIENTTIRELILQNFVDKLIPQLSECVTEAEALRCFLLLPLYHEFCNPRHHQRLQEPFAQAVKSLTSLSKNIVTSWWLQGSTDYFERLVNLYKNIVIYLLQQDYDNPLTPGSLDPDIKPALEILAFLNQLNNSVTGLKVPYDTFHIPEINSMRDVRVDYIAWLHDNMASRQHLCNYPFLFNAEAKIALLQTDQAIQMQSAMNDAASRAFLMVLTHVQPNAISQYLVLNVSRKDIVMDTLQQLTNVDTADLKKPLKVRFQDEEADDAGGVRKEFFMLLVRELFDKKYGIFEELEPAAGTLWFAEHTFESDLMYSLIGIVCGLAIYNFTIIALPFPLALYKKLLGEPVGLADLQDLTPTLARSLQQLLDYDSTNDYLFQDTFALTFEITRDAFGAIKTIPLKRNGANIPVTLANRKEYVDLYVDYILNKSIESSYLAFSTGFLKVCDGRVLKLFHSHELQSVIVGNQNYDWEALQENAEYKDGYNAFDETIVWFWEVFHELSLEDKKKFLLFLTGSDRVPLTGMKTIPIIIQPTSDDKYLPVAHTCFNLLDLPRYRTKERLRYKLLQAIQQTEGFSLV